MPKTKTGEIITWKEFMNRWKSGIEKITPEQQLFWQLFGSSITLIGIISGIIITFFSLSTLWWLSLILIGALFNTTMGMVALLQKRILLNKLKGGQNGFI